jgi:hypothetical protein
MIQDALARDVHSPSCHMYILKVGIVGSGFQNQDLRIQVFSEAACYHATGCTATDE